MEIPEDRLIPAHVAEAYLAAHRRCRVAVEGSQALDFSPEDCSEMYQTAHRALRQIENAVHEWIKRLGDDRSIFDRFIHNHRELWQALLIHCDLLSHYVSGKLPVEEQAARPLEALAAIELFIADWRMEQQGTRTLP